MPKDREELSILGPLFENLSDAEDEDQELLEEESEDEDSSPAEDIYTVSELAGELRDSLKNQYPRILVQGEIADFKGVHRSGHLYFSLKDEKAQIRAVMWRGSVAKLGFDIEGGQEVIATGRIDFYPGGGSLQIVVEHLEPVGIGALQLKFEQLKKKLEQEGLFDASRKREIAAINWRIGIVTGKSTAAFQDMLKIFRHRFPLAELFLFHASVQGERAPHEITRAIEAANEFSRSRGDAALDCLIVARGGGSYEDLFCFNDESVARAIVASELPVVTGIGHQIDVTIADMVSDKRAATPTHAAQLSVPDIALWFERLEQLRDEMSDHVLEKIQDLRQELDTYYNRLVAASPQKRLETQKQFLEETRKRLVLVMNTQLSEYKHRVATLASKMDALSPLKVFERGYSLTLNDKGQPIKSIKELKKDDMVTLRLADGKKPARVL